MQVSHALTDAAVASVGTGKSTGFGMASSAELMLNLADGLYQNKRLAMTREVICNAWDAHICAGVSDKAIQVTLTDSLLTIRDVAGGIPDHLINDIYCTYGASTKVFSNEETGGFGFGSKAPYAYTDQFVVVNRNSGKKTIYSMIKSDPNEEGRPSATPVMTTPLPDGEEEGLEVQINLKAADRYRIQEYLRYFAHWGDMRISINGEEELPRYEYPQEPGQKWLLSTVRPSYMGVGDEDQNSSYGLFAIKIGTVIYPLVPDERYKAMWGQISDFIAKSHSYLTFMILAEPGMVVPTPSRESIQMNSQSIEYIHDAMFDFCERFNKAIVDETPQIASRMIDIIKSRPANLFRDQKWHELPEEVGRRYLKEYANLGKFTKTAVFDTNVVDALNNIMSSIHTLPHETAKELSVLRQNHFFESVRSEIGTFDNWEANVKDWLSSVHSHSYSTGEKRIELHDKYLTPLKDDLEKIASEEKGIEYGIYNEDRRYYYGSQNFIVNFKKFRDGYADITISTEMLMERKEVILATSIDNFRERQSQYYQKYHQTMTPLLRTENLQGSQWANGCIFVKVPRRKSSIDRVRKYFEDKGYKVHDFSKKFKWEILEKQEEATDKTSNNYLSLKSYLNPSVITRKTVDGLRRNISIAEFSKVKKNTEPKYIMNSIDGYMTTFEHGLSPSSRAFVARYLAEDTALIHGERSVRAITKIGAAKHIIYPMLQQAIHWMGDKDFRENFIYTAMCTGSHRANKYLDQEIGPNHTDLWIYQKVNKVPALSRKLFGRSFKTNSSYQMKMSFILDVLHYSTQIRLNQEEIALLKRLKMRMGAIPYKPVFKMWIRKLNQQSVQNALLLTDAWRMGQVLSERKPSQLKLLAVSLATTILKGIRTK